MCSETNPLRWVRVHRGQKLTYLFRRRIRTEIGGKIADQDEARRVVANIDEASRTERQPERRNG